MVKFEDCIQKMSTKAQMFFKLSFESNQTNQNFMNRTIIIQAEVLVILTVFKEVADVVTCE